VRSAEEERATIVYKGRRQSTAFSDTFGSMSSREFLPVGAAVQSAAVKSAADAVSAQ
jgi:hypothetical protein